MGEKGFLERVSCLLHGRGKESRCRWRSSRAFIITVLSIAMFSGKRTFPCIRIPHHHRLISDPFLDTFLFSFIIPILPVVLEDRLQSPPAQTQRLTSVLLSMNALISILLAPVVGYFADKVSFRNGLLILAWVVNIVGTAITGWSTTGESIHLY